MFDLEKLDKKVVWILTVIHWIVYIGFCLLAPCITIIHNYNLETNAEATKISGGFLCVIIIFIFLSLGVLKPAVRKIKIGAFIWKARLKFVLDFILTIAIPIALLLIASIIKDNVDLAVSTIRTSIIFILIGITENFLLGSSLERENELIDSAKEYQNILKRQNKL